MMRTILFIAIAYAYRTVVLAQSVDSYIASESIIAKAGLLANIGSHGSKSSGAKSGVVIASPSNINPDYLFTWTRDSALVFKVIIDQYTTGIDTTLRSQIDNYVSSQATIQQVSNPSGTVSTGGLGDPKFNIDESAFLGDWGRPQRDGPALRATALITYANWLISHSNTSFVISHVWPVIELDLSYTKSNWNESTFDLWEEIDSSSFFTTAVQHRALREGAALASKLGHTSLVSGLTNQAQKALCFLQSYWNPSGGFITANTGGGRSGKDANTVLSSIHTFDIAAGCDATTFQPCSDKALSNLKVYVDSFRSIYTINENMASNEAVATGRYPEDSYQGGNPWYITTSAVAEQLYDALTVWKMQGSLSVTTTSLAFFSQFAEVSIGTYSSSSETFTILTSAIKTFADGFLAINALYTPSGGSLAEQYSRSNGEPASAVDLTWSYASVLTAFGARAGTTTTWGAAGLELPTTCSTGESGGTVAITFNVNATTVFKENIYLTGSLDVLQDWSTSNALLMSSDDYPIWSIKVNVPASTTFQYKYIRIFKGTVTWESDPNNQFTSSASKSTIVKDTWR